MFLRAYKLALGFEIYLHFFKLTLDMFLEVIIDVKHRVSVTPNNRILPLLFQTSSHFFEYFFTSPQPLIALAICPPNGYYDNHRTTSHTKLQLTPSPNHPFYITNTKCPSFL